MTTIKELQEMKAQLDKYLSEYFAMCDSNKETQEELKKFDIKISILGKEYSLSSDADTYNTLYDLVVNRIKDC
jgi:uncharacterized protein (DUF1015 family)